MRLLKIGRDASCNIVLQSDKVSALHAEMTLLNNGDILLEDKNSRNGTFLMNKPIKPGVAISVKRGDAIRFGDVELMWNQIPMPENNSNFKALFGIGTNFHNEIQVSGNTVSRFHATLKISKDNKPYLQDHSKNGTTVNGIKIPTGQNVRIKRSDAIVCGGVPVDLRPYIHPDPWKKIAAGFVAAAVLVGIIWGILNIPSKTASLKHLQNATACVYGEYVIEVTLEDDPFIGKIDGWPNKWTFGKSRGSKSNIPILEALGNEIEPFAYTGTAFFISTNGDLGTNRHIALPWEYLSTDEEDAIRTQMQMALNSNNRDLIKILQSNIEKGRIHYQIAQAYFDRLQKSPIRINGRHTFLGVALCGNNLSSQNDCLACQVIDESKDVDKDVALLRLNDPKTPEHIVKNGFFDITKARTDETSLVPQEETLITMGYPKGLTIAFSTGHALELLPTVHKVYVSKKPDDNQFQFQGQGLGGQSGSPIIDEKRRLVGVLYGGYTNTEISYGCNIKHLVELYNKHVKKP